MGSPALVPGAALQGAVGLLRCRRFAQPVSASRASATGPPALSRRIDPIPDFILGVGLLDEMVVVPIGILIATKMIPREVFEECKEKAREVAEGERPVSRAAAVVIVAVWLLCVVLAVFVALRVF